MKKIILVWAMDKNWLIGNGNKLPWSYSEDKKHFKNLTHGKVVLMGSRTYESMKEYYKNRSLPFHIVYVADQFDNKYEDAIKIPNLKWFLKNVDDTIYIIGGATIYKEALPYADELYITHIDAEHEGDVYMEKFELLNHFELENSVEHGILKINKYVRKNKEQWDEIMKLIDLNEDKPNEMD